jgi:hypothetical protein
MADATALSLLMLALAVFSVYCWLLGRRPPRRRDALDATAQGMSDTIRWLGRYGLYYAAVFVIVAVAIAVVDLFS